MPRQSLFNKDFFENINSEEKAYWLGFFFADVCLWHNTKTYSYTINFQLGRIDTNHIKKLLKSINGTNKFQFFTRTKEYKGQKKTFKYVKITLSSKKMFNDLIHLGCTPQKSLKLQYPNIPSELDRHFIRGFIDGDGSWHITKRDKTIVCTMKSNKEILIKIKQIIKATSNVRPDSSNSPQLYRLCIQGNNKCKKLHNWLYKDSVIFLDRKKQLCEKHFKLLDRRIK